MEPTAQNLGGASAGRTVKRYALATRPMFYPASLLPVMVGTSWGAYLAGGLDAAAALLALTVAMVAHAGANVLNDLYDDVSGADRDNSARIFPYTGGSRFIQNEVLSRAQMGGLALFLLVAAAALVLWLYALRGWPVLAFGLAGLGLGVLYSLPPAKLAARGLGELAAGVALGVIPVLGSVWLQYSQIGWSALVLALPVSIWVTNVLLLNEVPDAIADARAGKRTLVVRLGAPRTGTVYATLSVLAFIAAFSFGVYARLTAWGFVPLILLLLLALDVARRVISVGHSDGVMRRAIEVTLTIHALGCLWLMAWIWI